MRKFVTTLIVFIIPLVFYSCSAGDAHSVFDKGLLEMKAGNITKAKEIFDSIKENDSTSPYADYGQAIFYEMEGFLFEAVNANYLVQVNNLDFLPTLYQSARLLEKMDIPGVAFFDISLYREKGGDPKLAFETEIDLYLDAGKVDEAAHHLEKYRAEMGNDPLFKILEAQYFIHTGEYANGLKLAGEAVGSGGSDPDINQRVGDFYRDLGLTDSAYYYYDKAVTLVPNDYYLKLDIAEKLIDIRYYFEAEKLLDIFAARAGESHRYCMLKSLIFSDQGYHKNAFLEYSKIVQKYSLFPTTLTHMAFLKVRENDNQLVKNYSDMTVSKVEIEKYPKVVVNKAANNEVDNLLAMKKFQSADEISARVIDSFPNNFRTVLNAVQLNCRFQNREKYEANRAKLVDLITSIPANKALAGDMYLQVDSMLIAANYFKEVLDVDKTNPVAIMGALEIHRRKGELSGAVDFLNKYDEYLSYRPIIAEEKLSILTDLGEFTTAAYFGQIYLNNGKRDLTRYKLLGNIYLQNNQPDMADELYLNCTVINADNVSAWILAGNYFLDKKDYETAEEMANKAIELDSLNSQALILLADVFAATDKIDKAVELYEKAIKIDQFAGRAIGAMALIRLKRGEDPMAIINFARRAYMYDNTNPMHLFTQGLAYQMVDKYSMALNQFQYALKLAPNNPEYNYYAGYNCYKMDSTTMARTFIEKSLDLGLAGDLKKEAQKILKDL